MQKLTERKRLFIKILVVILLVLLCCNLPSVLFWPLCAKQDRDIPPNTEVLVSACKRPHVRGVPGGEVLFVQEGETGKMYLLDLRTGEKRDLPNDPLFLGHGVFLSSELVWLEGSLVGPENPSYRPHYILDLTNGQRYELLDLDLSPRLVDKTFDPKYYSYFKSAGQVFIHNTENTLIALSLNFRQHPEENVVFSQSSLGSSNEGYKNGELLAQLMKNLGVDYEVVDFSLYSGDVPSPTGKYIVSYDGIYISETNIQIGTSGMANYFKGWYYDESGVVVHDAGHNLLPVPGGGGIFFIRGPVLKLRLPAP